MSTQTKPVLYIDVDDTILCNMQPGGGFELRPVQSILRDLMKWFDCRWLTCVSEERVRGIWLNTYARDIAEGIQYQPWDGDNKAATVLAGPEDFWWLEDELVTREMVALTEKSKLDRYIPVRSTGMTGFHDAVGVLYRRLGPEFFGVADDKLGKLAFDIRTSDMFRDLGQEFFERYRHRFEPQWKSHQNETGT